MRRSFILSTIIPTAFFVAAVAAQEEPSNSTRVYTWTDENGTVHFTEEPPKGVEAEALDVEPVPGVPVPNRARATPAASDGEENLSPGARARQERQEREQAARERAAQQANLDTACSNARQQVVNLESRTNVLVPQPGGGTRRLDDDERLEMLETAKSFVAQNCD